MVTAAGVTPEMRDACPRDPGRATSGECGCGESFNV